VKCVCGYEGENFIVIDIFKELKTMYTLNWGNDRKYIYVCPKCGTLRAEVKNG